MIIIIREISRISHMMAHALHASKWSFYSKFEASMIFNSPLKRQKYFLIERFGEYIHQLLIGMNMLKFDISLSNIISNEMMSNFNMLSSRMLHDIMCNLNSTLIITKQWNMSHMYPIIFESFGHPK